MVTWKIAMGKDGLYYLSASGKHLPSNSKLIGVSAAESPQQALEFFMTLRMKRRMKAIPVEVSFFQHVFEAVDGVQAIK